MKKRGDIINEEDITPSFIENFDGKTYCPECGSDVFYQVYALTFEVNRVICVCGHEFFTEWNKETCIWKVKREEEVSQKISKEETP